MKSYSKLPDGYFEIYSVDLQKNKKVALFVNLLAIFIAVALAIPAAVLVPISKTIDYSFGIGNLLLKFAAVGVLTVLYMVLHELVHGAAMKICGTKKIKYGFTGMYAFAGSDDYYDKRAYIFIALAPVVLWGVVLAVASALVPASWFWVVYVIQITNISGAAGDFFVTVKFLRMPRDLVVRDYGVGMHAYTREN